MLPEVDRDLHRLRQSAGFTAVAGGYLTLDGQGEARSAVAAHGARRSDQPELVTAQDLWHIGSVGKSMTATLLALLQEDAVLQFDQSIPDLLPDIDMHSAWREVTLAHLLHHTSGLPANLPLALRRQNPDTDTLRWSARADALTRVLAKPPRSKPGAKFVYSNLGYTLAGHCAEVCAQQPFQPLMRERLWGPLDLNSAGFGPPLAQPNKAEPLGHRTFWRWRFPQDPSQGQVDNTSIIDPAGCMHISIPDLLAYGATHLAGRWPELRIPDLEDYACGWVLKSPQPRAYPLVWHNGSNTLWYCLLILAPQQQAVVALVTNDGSIGKAERNFFKLAYQWLDAAG